MRFVFLFMILFGVVASWSLRAGNFGSRESVVALEEEGSESKKEGSIGGVAPPPAAQSNALASLGSCSEAIDLAFKKRLALRAAQQPLSHLDGDEDLSELRIDWTQEDLEEVTIDLFEEEQTIEQKINFIQELLKEGGWFGLRILASYLYRQPDHKISTVNQGYLQSEIDEKGRVVIGFCDFSTPRVMGKIHIPSRFKTPLDLFMGRLVTSDSDPEPVVKQKKKKPKSRVRRRESRLENDAIFAAEMLKVMKRS